VGVYDIGIRAMNLAGNWSAVTSTMLVVYDPSTALRITGKNKKDLIPSLTNGDHLPGLISSGQSDAADYGFTVEYRTGTLDPRNDFHFTYVTGTQCNPNPQNCHRLSLDATSLAWLIIDQTNNSRGRFQGTANLIIDGVNTSSVFTIEALDGDRLTPATDDHLILRIYTTNANPDTDAPLYQASGAIPRGNAVRIN
jgi:hypothetical protein